LREQIGNGLTSYTTSLQTVHAMAFTSYCTNES